MKTITLVIPLYNEAHRIRPMLKALECYQPPKGTLLKEVRFVSDGSTDRTVVVLNNWKKKFTSRTFKVNVISYKQNHGRGYALRTGLTKILTDYAVYIDGDLDIPLSNIERLVRPMKIGIDVIMGSKKMPQSICTEQRRLTRVLMGYGHSVLAGVILGQWRWDWQGGFKAFSREVLNDIVPGLKIDRWGFDMEIVFWSAVMGYTVTEVPLEWGATAAGSTVKPVRDIARALRDMVSIRWRWLNLIDVYGSLQHPRYAFSREVAETRKK